MNEYVSSVEVIRFIAAAYGLYISWRHRREARASIDSMVLPPAPDPPTSQSMDDLDSYEDQMDRLGLSESLQTSFALIHILLLVNVVVNFWYPSASFEQPNVATSNMAQILIPAFAVWASKLVAGRLKFVAQNQRRHDRRHARETLKQEAAS